MQYKIVQGDCLSSVARRFGFADWRTIYDHPNNAEFREKRPNPNLIYPGDQLFVPETKKKSVTVATGQVHVITVNLPVVRLHLQLRDLDDHPASDVPYTLRSGTFEVKGKTKNGVLECQVPANLTSAELTLGDKGTRQLAIGTMDPADTVSGIQGRLHNLGYYSGQIDGIVGPETESAVRTFQEDNPPLKADGVCNEKTRDALVKKYGC